MCVSQCANYIIIIVICVAVRDTHSSVFISNMQQHCKDTKLSSCVLSSSIYILRDAVDITLFSLRVDYLKYLNTEATIISYFRYNI